MRLERLCNVIDRALPVLFEDAVAQEILEHIHLRLIGRVVDKKQAARHGMNFDALQKIKLREFFLQERCEFLRHLRTVAAAPRQLAHAMEACRDVQGRSGARAVLLRSCARVADTLRQMRHRILKARHCRLGWAAEKHLMDALADSCAHHETRYIRHRVISSLRAS